MKRNKQKMGQLGEDFAVTYLKRLGYRILERNFRCRLGEIDIIAKKGKELVFVEVKTRSSCRFGHPQDAVTPAKQAKLRTVASFFLKRFDKSVPCRFDVLAISIEGDMVRPQLIRNAF
ncbi:MAG: YraN family protein [bacterium]